MTSKKSGAWLRSDRAKLGLFAAFIGAVLLVSALTTGCGTTVQPDIVTPSVASYDGNVQNSGIIMSTNSGFVVTSHFRERHNALIAIYGGDFSPHLKPDHGIAPMGDDRWLISKQAMVDFLAMNTWRKAALKPVNP